MFMRLGRFMQSRRLGLAVLGLVACVWSGIGQWAVGQDQPASQQRMTGTIDPAQLGIVLPSKGPIEPGAGRRVVTVDEAGRPVVAKLHLRAEDGLCVVMLPSGRLVSMPGSKTIPTERPFKPMDGAELVGRLKNGPLEEFQTATGSHYLYLYKCNDSFYQATHDILESLHEGVIEQLTKWGLPVEPPSVPLVALIFPDRASFDAFHQMPAGVLAYYSAVNNLIVLYEDPELSDAAPELALKQAAYTIAHEGVHQILFNVGVQQRLSSWPAWLSEGVPELFCPVRVTSSMAKDGTDSMPRRSIRWSRVGMVNDLRMFDLLRMKPESGSLIEKTVAAERLGSDGYAIAWGLVHYLNDSQPKQFQSYLREIAATPALNSLGPENDKALQALFAKYWGADFKRIESGVTRHLNSKSVKDNYRDPLVYQTYYLVVHTALRGKTAKVTAMVTTSPDGARQWRAEEQKKKDPSLKHGFRAIVCETRQKAEAELGRIGPKR